MKMQLLASLVLSLFVCGPATADLFLVTTSDGPGFASPDEAAEVLEKGIIPTFNKLIELKKNKTIVVGGLPAGSRTFYLIMEANSHDEIDKILRDLPAWGVFAWHVKPLQSLEGRAEMEQQNLLSLKARK